MKKQILFLIGLIAANALLAQAPHGISHQAVIRDANNELVANSQIGIQVSILQGSAEGEAVYVETHSPTSNANGLISYIIGAGDAAEGLFAEIEWSSGPFFLKTEADPTGGTNYSITGVTQFLSVPYAMHSKTSEELTLPYAETDPFFSATFSITDPQEGMLLRYSAVSERWTEYVPGYAYDDHTHTNATADADGFMSFSDKDKLNGIEPGANVNINADWNADSGDAQILNKPTTLSGYGITDALPLTGGYVTGPINATGESTTLSGFNAAMVHVTSTEYTLASGDNGKIINIDSNADVSVMIPADLPPGFNCMIVQKSEGKAVFSGVGTSIHNRNGFTKTAGMYAIATVIHLGDNIFIVSGDMNN